MVPPSANIIQIIYTSYVKDRKVEGQEYYIAMIKAGRKKNGLPGLSKKKLDTLWRSLSRAFRDHEPAVANERVQVIIQKYINERRP
jgi:hypothetical protein